MKRKNKPMNTLLTEIGKQCIKYSKIFICILLTTSCRVLLIRRQCIDIAIKV